ncbi:hypothetical protein BGZ94_001678 [Podila epigama]|nr:hypothetical protein BGZ94_001678 [Podila epigama]
MPTPLNQTRGNKPRVLIVGAGLGGVTLGILLEKAGIPYDIFERAAIVKPLGSAISLGASILTFFEQIGILEEFLSHGKPTITASMYNEKRELQNVIDFGFLKEVGGHYNYIVSRPLLYDMLLRMIPAQKLHFSKRVLSTSQGEHGVLLRTSDGMTHEGDILVGADGAYSAVRQTLFDQLMKENKLPSSDSTPLPFTCVALVGQTMPLDTTRFPEVASPECLNSGVISASTPYSLMTFTTKYHTICWVMLHHLDSVSSKYNDSFRNTEWGPEAAEQMCKEVRDFAIPGGDGALTMGDLIDNTPKHLISKVMLEEKVFETWYSGRTVLLGDACHKMNPAGGMGAINAMQDAITIANWIEVLDRNSTMAEIEKAFKEYKKERYPWALSAYRDSQIMSKLVAVNLTGKIARYATKKMPAWAHRLALSRVISYRPQASFLPLAPDRGSKKATSQPSLKKTRKWRAKKEAAEASAKAKTKTGEVSAGGGGNIHRSNSPASFSSTVSVGDSSNHGYSHVNNSNSYTISGHGYTSVSQGHSGSLHGHGHDHGHTSKSSSSVTASR